MCVLNVRRTMCTAIVSYLLKYFYTFSAAELNDTEREDEVFAQQFSYEESDSGDSEMMKIFLYSSQVK